MNSNITPSNNAVLAGVIDPDAYATGDYSTGWIDMGNYEAVQAIVAVGTLGTSATVDAKLEQATDALGTGVKNIAGKAIAQLTQAGTDSDKQAIINLQSAELDTVNGFRYVRLTITVGTATSDAGAVVLGHYARYQPAAAVTTVAEVVF